MKQQNRRHLLKIYPEYQDSMAEVIRRIRQIKKNSGNAAQRREEEVVWRGKKMEERKSHSLMDASI